MFKEIFLKKNLLQEIMGIDSSAWERINTFAKYIERSYVPSDDCEEARFPISSWNKYEDTIAGNPRTNNVSEGTFISFVILVKFKLA